MPLTQSLTPFSLLIVEDDKAARDVIARVIPSKYPNCTVYTAENGMQGRELFRQFTPDVVVTDINMPVMEGFEMIHEINAINPNAALIVLTAYSDKVTFEKFRDLNVCTYLLKPLDFKELFAAIEKCCPTIVLEPE
jgi:YesN/AraC family two-component response regulator